MEMSNEPISDIEETEVLAKLIVRPEAQVRSEPESATRCCLCPRPAIHAERRPTAKDGNMQTWSFCSQCWQQLQAERRNIDTEICRRYLIFVRYVIHGDP